MYEELEIAGEVGFQIVLRYATSDDYTYHCTRGAWPPHFRLQLSVKGVSKRR